MTEGIGQWGTTTDIDRLCDAIEGFHLVDWPDDDFSGRSVAMHHVLARLETAIGGATPIYACGKVDLAVTPPQVLAHIFTTHQVVVVSGEATRPQIVVRPNHPVSVSITAARITTLDRERGHVAFTVSYSWGEVTVSERDRFPIGTARALLDETLPRLGEG